MLKKLIFVTIILVALVGGGWWWHQERERRAHELEVKAKAFTTIRDCSVLVDTSFDILLKTSNITFKASIVKIDDFIHKMDKSLIEIRSIDGLPKEIREAGYDYIWHCQLLLGYYKDFMSKLFSYTVEDRVSVDSSEIQKLQDEMFRAREKYDECVMQTVNTFDSVSKLVPEEYLIDRQRLTAMVNKIDKRTKSNSGENATKSLQ